MPRKSQTLSDFIAKAHAVHGVGTYDYSLVVYAGYAKRVIIICPVHGEFRQTPGAHVLTTRKPAGCQRCAYKRMGKQKAGNTEAFIAKAEAIYGVGTFDYSQAVYSGKRAKIKIICPRHGIFEHEPVHFWLGRGCPACGAIRRRKTRTLTTADFITKAVAVHGVGRYDYSQTVYIDSRLKVKIICPQHGIFEQKPSTHNYGSGCPYCGEKLKTKHSREGWAAYANGRASSLYFIRLYNECEAFYKVGLTCRPVRERHKQIERLSGYNCEVLAVYRSANAAAAWDWEQSILETFIYLSYRPKQRFGGETECFSSAEEILAIFPL